MNQRKLVNYTGPMLNTFQVGRMFFKSSCVFLCTFKGSATQPVKTAIMSSVALVELSNVGANNHW